MSNAIMTGAQHATAYFRCSPTGTCTLFNDAKMLGTARTLKIMRYTCPAHRAQQVTQSSTTALGAQAKM